MLTVLILCLVSLAGLRTLSGVCWSWLQCWCWLEPHWQPLGLHSPAWPGLLICPPLKVVWNKYNLFVVWRCESGCVKQLWMQTAVGELKELSQRSSLDPAQWRESRTGASCKQAWYEHMPHRSASLNMDIHNHPLFGTCFFMGTLTLILTHQSGLTGFSLPGKFARYDVWGP